MKDEEELRKKAEKRAEEKVDFLIHFTIYVCVNALLVVAWYFSSEPFPWFIFPMVGWGIGITAHFFGAFATPNLRDKFTEKEYERLKRK